MKIKEIILKIYEEYFELPEDGKIREKVFIARIAMSVVVMGIWLYMMGFSAYAYFSSSVTSGVNVIKSATYSLDITDVTEPDGKIKVTGEYVLKNENIADNKTFVFKLEKAGNASVGYCKIITKEGTEPKEEIYTTPIGTYQKDGEKVEVLSKDVKITVPPNTTMTVEFVVNWGSYSGNNAVANVVLDYGLAEETLQQLQAASDNATTPTQSENPASTEADASEEKTGEGGSAPSDTATGGTENSSDETIGTTTDKTVGGASTDTTSSGSADTTSDGVDDTSNGTSDDGTTDTPQEGSDASSTGAEETTQINEETTEGTGELMN